MIERRSQVRFLRFGATLSPLLYGVLRFSHVKRHTGKYLSNLVIALTDNLND